MLLRHIRYFLAVAEHRNFTRAAEALHVSQPTLSQQIRQLEDTLRVQLLDRSGRTIQLTDAGAAYVRYAQRALRIDVELGARLFKHLVALPTTYNYSGGSDVRHIDHLEYIWSANGRSLRTHGWKLIHQLYRSGHSRRHRQSDA